MLKQKSLESENLSGISTRIAWISPVCEYPFLRMSNGELIENSKIKLVVFNKNIHLGLISEKEGNAICS